MNDPPLVQYACRSDEGMRRAANQDSLVVRMCREDAEWHTCGHLFVMADGMGGHAVGDLASRIAVDSLPIAYFKLDAPAVRERLIGAMQAANKAIGDKARENPEFTDMGTTCSALSLSSSGAMVGHVGDSRVYRIRGTEIQQLTFDHSLQWEMIRAGRATIENVDMLHPRNVITRCLGPDSDVMIDVEGPFHVQAGDRFLLCSDGLTNHVDDSEIGAVVNSMPPTDAARLLIHLANLRGGSDNVSVIVVNVERYPEIPTPVVDPPAAKTNPSLPKIPAVVGSGRSRTSEYSLVVFSFLATLGLAGIAFGQQALGLSLVCVAVILGFIRLIVSAGRSGELKNPSAGLPVSELSGLTLSESSLPAAKSPYRRAGAEVPRLLIEHLAEMQSQLTQAAHANGWKVDRDALADLQRQAIAAVKQDQLPQCVRLRAQAIEMLMKDYYLLYRNQQQARRT
ncbi:MAG: serine/threonine-protein phosphatase [Planctomycetaceae bacterium]|nr:serine/threonine-protein phosphatase [Planctomycetaceae bacterium]